MSFRGNCGGLGRGVGRISSRSVPGPVGVAVLV